MSNAKEVYSKLSQYYVEYAVLSTPEATPKIHGVKAVRKNKDYIIKVDMASGYLKVYDRNLKTFLDKYGNPVSDGPDSHMKILRK